MTPKQQKIWLLLEPGKWYSAPDVGISAEVETDIARCFLRRLLKDGYVTTKADAKSGYRIYMRTNVEPKIAERREAKKPRADVWLETWPHADPVVTQTMHDFCDPTYKPFFGSDEVGMMP